MTLKNGQNLRTFRGFFLFLLLRDPAIASSMLVSVANCVATFKMPMSS